MGYSTYLGGSGWEWGYGIGIGGTGRRHRHGIQLLRPTSQRRWEPSRSRRSVFVTLGSGTLAYSTPLGDGRGNGIAVDFVGNVFVTGSALSGSR